MEQQNFQTNLIISIPNVQLNEIINKKSKQKDYGVLNVFQVSNVKMLIIELNEFKYSLTNAIPILYGQSIQDGNLYVMPATGGNYYSLSFPINTSDDILQCFNYLLCTNAHVLEISQENHKGSPNTQDDDVKNINKQTNAQRISQFLIKGSETISNGIKKGQEYLSKKIDQGGEYAVKKMKKSEQEKIVSEKTMSQIQTAKNMTNAVVSFTREELKLVFNLLATIGEEVGESFGKTETGQKIQSNKSYEDAKEIGKGIVYAGAITYDSLVEAFKCTGRKIQENSSIIATHKYGEKYGQAVHDSMDVVGNVGNLTRVGKDAIKDVIKDKKEKEDLKKRYQ